MGTFEVRLQFEKSIFLLKAVVVETNAFDAALGTDFTENEHFGGLVTQPTRLLIDGQEIPLSDDSSGKPRNYRLFRLFKTESYSLTKNLRDQVLKDLEVPSTSILIDVFANHRNYQETLYLTRENSAWRYNWTKLLRSEKDFLWLTPPFRNLQGW